MAITGKKINELEGIVNPTLETVLPAVKVEGSTTSDTATKITLQDIKTISQEGVLAQPNIQNLSGTNITINTLTANTIYQCGTISSLTISNFENSYEESLIYFTTNSSDFTLTFTITPTWLEGSQPTLELSKNYILHLRNGIASIQGGSNNIIIDDTLSNNSENPVQNKVITNALSNKANLTGGNSFIGKQQIYQWGGVDYAITFNREGVTGAAGFTVGANGVVLSAPSNNLDINNRTVFKNITTLGNIAGTTQSLSAFTVEGCYTANLNGTATIKLPTPTSTQAMKENTINILLNVIGESNIAWQDINYNGINANNCMTTFAVGKYLIRLRYNNATSNWIGEVLKGVDTVNSVKLFISGSGIIADLSNNPISVAVYNNGLAVYETGNFTDTQAFESKAVGTTYKYGVLSGNNLSKLNLGTGDFTISFWSKNSGQAVRALFKDAGNYISNQYFYINGMNILGQYFSNESDWVYITYARSGNNLYAYKNGNLLITTTYSGSVDLSDFIYLNYNYSSGYSTLLQDLVIENSYDTSRFAKPTVPYAITDNSLSDYHDDTKQNVLTTIKGFNASATQTLKNINGVIQWVTD